MRFSSASTRCELELNQANADYEAAVQSHDDAVEAMNAAQARIDSAEERIDELQVRLGDRANEMYKTGGSTSFVDVLLGASSFAEFLTSWDMIERITSQRLFFGVEGSARGSSGGA